MKKLILYILISFMLFGTVSALVACQSDSEKKMEQNLQEARDAMKEMKRLEQEAKDIMNKP